MYSDSVVTWVRGSTVTATERRGWAGQLWTCLTTTTDEPSPQSANWQLDTPLTLTGLSLLTIPDNKEFLQTKLTGITLMEQHISRPSEVNFTGLRLTVEQKSFLTISTI